MEIIFKVTLQDMKTSKIEMSLIKYQNKQLVYSILNRKVKHGLLADKAQKACTLSQVVR